MMLLRRMRLLEMCIRDRSNTVAPKQAECKKMRYSIRKVATVGATSALVGTLAFLGATQDVYKRQVLFQKLFSLSSCLTCLSSTRYLTLHLLDLMIGSIYLLVRLLLWLWKKSDIAYLIKSKSVAYLSLIHIYSRFMTLLENIEGKVGCCCFPFCPSKSQ